MRLLAVVVLVVCIAGLAYAANDPGHDSLYVLLNGDSNVTGTINISANLTSSTIRVATLLYGDLLHLRANGSVFSVSSRPTIQAASTSLYIDGNGNVYIGTRDGGTGLVQMGDTSTNAITLNVSGSILQQNVMVCLQNGSNCPGSLGSANITGSGAANYLAKWTSSSDLSTSIIYDDGSRVGVGTASIEASRKLHVEAGNVSLNSTYSMCFSNDCTSRIYYNGSALIVEGT